MKLKATASLARKQTPIIRLSVVVLMRGWQLSDREQEQLLALARFKLVQELILVGKALQTLPAALENEPKLRSFQFNSSSPALLTEAAAFEANAEILLVLKQGIQLSEHSLQAVSAAVASGCHFGGLISGKKGWWASFIKRITLYCKGLCWFYLSQAYFVSLKVYHHSGGFKQDGRLLSFFELLCRQKKLSSYTYLFY